MDAKFKSKRLDPFKKKNSYLLSRSGSRLDSKFEKNANKS